MAVSRPAPYTFYTSDKAIIRFEKAAEKRQKTGKGADGSGGRGRKKTLSSKDDKVSPKSQRTLASEEAGKAAKETAAPYTFYTSDKEIIRWIKAEIGGVRKRKPLSRQMTTKRFHPADLPASAPLPVKRQARRQRKQRPLLLP